MLLLFLLGIIVNNEELFPKVISTGAFEGQQTEGPERYHLFYKFINKFVAYYIGILILMSKMPPAFSQTIVYFDYIRP